jgi:hypothetical protein
MNVSEALKLFSDGRLDAELGNGPIARIADKLVEAADKAEAERMGRKSAAGAPMYSALKRTVEQARSDALADNELPVITRYDFCQFLKGAAEQLGKSEQSVRHASLMARQMWHDDPLGSLTIGEVAQMRAHYKREYPKSKAARVIEASLLATGFNTLALPKLTRTANEIASANLSANEIFSVYEGQGLNRKERSYINALLAMDPKKADVIENVSRRMAQETIDNEEPHIEDGILHGDEELGVTTSPYTDEEIVIEVGRKIEEDELEEDEEEMALVPIEEEEGMEFLGKLAEFVILPDPTTDGEENLRITIERDEPEEEDFEEEEYETTAIIDGEEEEEPLETFDAIDINAALQRLANFGVRGDVYRSKDGESIHVNVGDGNVLRVSKKGFVLTASDIEDQIISGDTVRHGRWSLRITDDDEVELSTRTAARTCSLAHLDTAISDFICMAAKKYNYRIATQVGENVPDEHVKHQVSKIAAAIKGIDSAATVSRSGRDIVFTANLDKAGINRVRTVLRSKFGVKVQAQALAPGGIPGAIGDDSSIGDPALAEFSSGPNVHNAPGSSDIQPPEQTPADEHKNKVGPEQTAERHSTEGLPTTADSTFDPTKKVEPPPACRASKAAQMMDMDTEIPEPIDLDTETEMMAEPEPEFEPAPMEMGPMTFEGLSGEESEAAEAGFTHYRNKGKGPAQAIHDFLNDYAEMMELYGEGAEPERHAAEADLVSIMSDVFAKPAITATAATEGNFAAEGDISAPKINQRPPVQTGAPQGKPSFKEKDKVSFGEKKPVARPNKKQKGKLSDTALKGDDTWKPQ